MSNTFNWTPLRTAFCEQMLVCDFNATKAYKAAGGTAKHADRAAAQINDLPEIKKRIDELKLDRSERTKVDADYVLNQAVKLHERCMQEVKPKTHRNGDPIVDENGDPVYEFNAAGAAKALELVGKHVEIQAFKERVELSGHIEMTNRILEARKRANSK